MVAWAFTLQGRARTVLATFAVASFALLAWMAGPSVTRVQAAPVQGQAQGPWQPWEPGRVDQVLASGQPVFVDFTAAWCVTCQYNKKAVLSNPELLAAFQSRNVAMLRADWTRRDPAITAALAQLGRSGVPVYVFYKPGKAPVVLSEILGLDEVHAALASL
jgi:thiol:disulfide interchange protein